MFFLLVLLYIYIRLSSCYILASHVACCYRVIAAHCIAVAISIDVKMRFIAYDRAIGSDILVSVSSFNSLKLFRSVASRNINPFLSACLGPMPGYLELKSPRPSSGLLSKFT
jgi:hypothetical protein